MPAIASPSSPPTSPGWEKRTAGEEEVDDEEVDEDYSPPVVAETTSSLRRMSVGEAVMELDLLQGDVVVFRHAGHGGLNVVYRRADGNIGWIDPANGTATKNQAKA